MTVCKRLRYAGRVQGVGFRATARMIANRHPVAGFVRNLPDGCVELVAEGPADGVTAFLDDLGERMRAYITDVASEDLPPEGFQAFTIRP